MLTDDEKELLRLTLLSLYMDSFVDGVYSVAREYGLESAIPAATAKAHAMLRERLRLVEKAVTGYIDTIEARAKEMKADGWSHDRILAELETEARGLADLKGQLVAEIETAKAEMDGALALAEASGKPFVWHFPHFDIRGDEECPICEEIRRGAPYTTEEAIAEGYPNIPHPNCDHGWVLAPA